MHRAAVCPRTGDPCDQNNRCGDCRRPSGVCVHCTCRLGASVARSRPRPLPQRPSREHHQPRSRRGRQFGRDTPDERRHCLRRLGQRRRLAYGQCHGGGAQLDAPDRHPGFAVHRIGRVRPHRRAVADAARGCGSNFQSWARWRWAHRPAAYDQRGHHLVGAQLSGQP